MPISRSINDPLPLVLGPAVRTRVDEIELPLWFIEPPEPQIDRACLTAADGRGLRERGLVKPYPVRERAPASVAEPVDGQPVPATKHEVAR
jgi:hypothetical protein